MGNTFTKIFIPVFTAILIILILLAIRTRWPRKCRDDDVESFRMTYVAGRNVNIDRLSTALAFPPHPGVRIHDGPPPQARSARRPRQYSTEMENPFIDPPTHTRSMTSFHTVTTFTQSNTSINEIPAIPAEHLSSYPNFSTPTRQNRFSNMLRNNNTSITPSRTAPTYSIAPPGFSSSPSVISPPARAYMPGAVKPAGRAPPLGPQLAKFPLPGIGPRAAAYTTPTLAASTSSHKHLHPNKLFSNLGLASSPSRTSTATVASSSNATATVTAPTAIDSSPVARVAQLPAVRPVSPLNIPKIKTSQASFVTTDSPISSLRSNSPPAEAGPQGAPRVVKTGAKTPVSAIREIFDKKEVLSREGSEDTIAGLEKELAAGEGIGAGSFAVGGVNIRASSIYSRDEEGKPTMKAPGGADWI